MPSEKEKQDSKAATAPTTNKPGASKDKKKKDVEDELVCLCDNNGDHFTL